ncbi:MAG: hypothetical protein AAB229_10950 [Candidatus Hydrogenedentota bacterium]
MQRLPHQGRLFLSLWLVLVFFGDPLLEINTVRYLFLSRAVAEDRSFMVDRFAHSSKGDLAVSDGHYYSGSLPGIGLMLSPVAALAHGSRDTAPFRPNLWLQILSLILFNAPAAALSAVLLGQVLVAFGNTPSRSFLLAVTAVLGTHLFFFTSKLSDYPIVTLLELIIIRAVMSARVLERKSLLLLIGGSLGIIATVNNLPAALMVLLLLFMFPLRPGTEFIRRWFFIILGAAPCVIARSLYLKQCFGSALIDPLAYSAAKISVVDMAREGSVLARIIAEAPRALFDITFGPVGLFLFAPVFLLLLLPIIDRSQGQSALHVSWRKCILLLALLNALAHCLLIGGIWRGGASWGPRYMLYSSTLLFIPMAYFARGIRDRSLALLAAVSVFINWIGVQYGYNDSLLDELGLFLLGGPTTPAFKLMWLHWAIVPSPERIALVMEETPRIGHYYAFTHPTPVVLYATLALLLILVWLPICSRFLRRDRPL